MKKYYALIFVCLLSISEVLIAQNGAVSTGISLIGGDRKISYSIGQPFYHVYQAASGRIREGLQQPILPPAQIYSHIIPTYLGTSGTSLSAMNRKISYTLGQPFYEMKSGSNGKVRDGIQQPLLAPVMLNLHLYIEGLDRKSVV